MGNRQYFLRCRNRANKSDGSDVWFIANEIFDINAPGGFDPDSNYGAGVAMHFRGNSSGGVVKNKIYSYDKGLQITSGSNYQILNNIFSSRGNQSSYDVMYRDSGLANSAVQNNNLFSDIRIKVCSSAYSTIAELRSDTGKESSGIVESPRFINADQHNFTITNNSDAVDSGMSSDVYSQFQARYGLNIRRDKGGVSRALLQGWDIGAREFGGGTVPNSPGNLQTAEK